MIEIEKGVSDLENRKVKIALIQFGGILADTGANTHHVV